jgi:hypothetical protein
MTGKPVISENTDCYFLLGCAEKKTRLCNITPIWTKLVSKYFLTNVNLIFRLNSDVNAVASLLSGEFGMKSVPVPEVDQWRKPPVRPTVENRSIWNSSQNKHEGRKLKKIWTEIINELFQQVIRQKRWFRIWGNITKKEESKYHQIFGRNQQ